MIRLLQTAALRLDCLLADGHSTTVNAVQQDPQKGSLAAEQMLHSSCILHKEQPTLSDAAGCSLEAGEPVGREPFFMVSLVQLGSRLSLRLMSDVTHA